MFAKGVIPLTPHAMRRSLIAGAVIGASLAASSVAARVQDAGLEVLDRLQKGAWEVRYRDSGQRQRICVKTGREFIELRHPSGGCGHYAVDGENGKLTVQYQCPGNGYGRTTVRVETGALVQIDGQGVAGGLPYQFNAEARRVGECS